MMQTAPMAPSAPPDGDQNPYEEVCDAYAQERAQRVAELHLSLMQHRPVQPPRERRAESEDDPEHLKDLAVKSRQ